MSSIENIAPPGTNLPPGVLSPTHSRIVSVDALRGAIMILMAIDHIRDFFNSAAMAFLPTDLSHSTAAIFLTRWITHFCAPVFCFTAGLGAYLWARRGRTKAQLSWFLATRGLWLIVLEITVLRFVFFLQIRFTGAMVMLIVFWMLGLSMIVLAGLVHLPLRVLAPLSIAVIALHNLADKIPATRFGRAAWLWNILHQNGAFKFHSVTFVVAYPLIPWVAVMAAGYSLGPVLLWDAARRRRFLLRLGVALSAAFVLLRGVNIYGDPARWTVQHSVVFTGLSFLNCTKYPPSLDFLLMTLGPALIALAWLERVPWGSRHPVLIFGRVPFFFFILHLAVIHALAIFMGYLRYGWAPFLLLPPPSMGSPQALFPPGYGYSLWVVYAVWVLVVAFLYPVCRWYAGLKQRRRDGWLSYL